MPARCSALTRSRNSSTGPERVLPRTVAGMGSEKRDRRISPVIDQARRTVLPVELEHRKQLHRGDPEILQVWDLLDHARIGPSPLRGDPGARMPREAGDVHLVDHGRREGPAQRRVTLPIVGVGVDHRRSSWRSHCSARIGSPRGESIRRARRRRARRDRGATLLGSKRRPRSGSKGPSARYA